MKPDQGKQLLDRVWLRLRLVGWIATLVGATVAFVAAWFLIPIFIGPDDRGELFRENLPVVIALLAIGIPAVTWLFNRMAPTAFAWLEEGRQPTDGEHERTLRWPVRSSLLPLLGWDVSAVILAGFNLFVFDQSFDFAVLVVIVMMLAGEATSAVIYLLSERAMRPVIALALAAREPSRPHALGIRRRLLFTWALSTGIPIVGVITVGIVGATKANVEIGDVAAVEMGDVAAASIFLGSVALLVGLLATVIVSRAISDPVTSLRSALERVARGDLETTVAINDASEIGQLQAGFNRMAEGLRERERIRDLFGRHVGQDVARHALDGGVRFSGEEREIGALFVDLVGSTSMALAMPPTGAVRLLNRFFRVVIEIVEREGGFVNKFEGDAALCVFGAPLASEDPAGEALSAARALAERLEREVPEIGFGIGVSAGKAVAGNVGSEQRFEYTVIGDPVNEAARLCDLAKEREERVVASDAAFERASADEREAWSVGERTVLRGRLEATGLATPRLSA